MADVIVIKIRNLDKIRSAFNRAPKIVERHLQNAVEAGIAEIQKKALRPVIPFDTGRLIQSIGEGISIGRLQGSIGPTVEYASFVDQGTRFMRPRRFMDKLAKRSQKAVQKQFNRASEKIVKDIARRI